MASSASDPDAAAPAASADAVASADASVSAGAAAAAHRRPLVGVTTYMQDAAWGVWSTEAVVLPAEYVRMVVTAGAVPVLLPPHGTDPSVLDALDGLILTGGADVGPDRYGAQPHPRTQAQPWRDDHEFALFAAARDRGLPVLGICRGLQVVNAALGGTLHQHVPEVLGTDRYQPAPGEYGQMIARTTPGSRIAAVVGESITAPCYHHQSVDRVGEGLTVTAHSDDGVIEVLEGATDEPWLLAVQWHPEHNPVDVRVVVAFVDAARTHAARGSDTAGCDTSDHAAPDHATPDHATADHAAPDHATASAAEVPAGTPSRSPRVDPQEGTSA